MRKWLKQQRFSLGIGVAVTLAAALLHGLGLTAALEWHTYDLLIRKHSTVPASDSILHVDVDDKAISQMSWPWPRDLQGQIVQILHELGAERILLDFLWTEPRECDVRLPRLDRYTHQESPVRHPVQVPPESIVCPDEELAAAVHDSGPVYLAMFDDIAESTLPPQHSALAAKIADLLRRDFSLSASALAAQLQAPSTVIEGLLARAKPEVADELVAEQLRHAAPSVPTAQQIHQALLNTPFDRQTADRKDILTAYERALSLRNVRQRCEPLPPGLAGKLPQVKHVRPPLHQLTASTIEAGTHTKPTALAAPAKDGIRLGLVNWQPQHEHGGTLRAIPLMWEWNGLLIEQLGFAAARDALGIRPDDLSIDDRGCLLIAPRGPRPAMEIQLDGHGQMLINWHVAPDGWQNCFSHLSITPILAVHEARECIRKNELLRQEYMDEALRTVNPESANLAFEQERSLAVDLIRQTWSQLASETNLDDPDIAEEYRRFRHANTLITEMIPDIDATNARIAEQERDLRDKLLPLIAGKTCMVGYTATAVADMVATPPYGRVPGVLVHSQLFNSMLQGRFLNWAGHGTQLLTIVLIGTMVSLVSAATGPRASLTLVIALIVVLPALSAGVIFARLDYYLPMTSALVTGFVVWALVVMTRYLVTDRRRRWFSRAVARYVSPAMARQIGESEENLTFDPVDARVTCFFSDLAGFTSLSEKLGPQGTRDLLNPYLEMMSSTLHRHRALVNKFMGDGIFAFFNAPILPCPNHEAAACEAALACRQALVELIGQYSGTPLGDSFRQLSMRIGISSGSAFVGDYGSEDKLDYTCMGDIVNLAARLESANKQLGTKLIVSAQTKDAAGDTYVYRKLGLLQVVGQSRGVEVYELLGGKDGVSPQDAAYAERFSGGVQAYGRQLWSQALADFEHCLSLRPDDVLAKRYIALIGRYCTEALPDKWEGTLELTEK